MQASFHRIVRAFQDGLAKGIEQALHIAFTGATFETAVKLGLFTQPCE